MAVFHNQGKSSASKEAAGAYNGPVSVGRFVTPIAGKTLSRGGAVLTELICEWPAIAGPALALYTRPEKLTKGAPEPNSAGKPAPSVLHLKVDPARALEVQYSTPQLIERINQNARLQRRVRLARRAGSGSQKRRQSHRPGSKPAPSKNEPPAPENRLSAALARMAQGVKARGCSG